MNSPAWTQTKAERHIKDLWRAYQENDLSFATLLYEATCSMLPEQWEQLQQFFRDHQQEHDTLYLSRLSEIGYLSWELSWKQRVLRHSLKAPRLCARCGVRFPAYQRRILPCGRRAIKILCQECGDLVQDGQLPCLVCDTLFRPNVHNGKFCRDCKKYQHEEQQVRLHNERARAAKQPGTLTLKEWLKILDLFDWRCAYCQGPYETFEHFLPLMHSGSTSASNCIPSCKHCNALKGKKHPTQLTNIFPGERIARISTLLLLIAQQQIPAASPFPQRR
jgi:hypothetical protein